MSDLFTEQLDWFKSQEKPETVLLVADETQRLKILIAWTNTKISFKETSGAPAEFDEHESWQWLWNQIAFNHDELKEKSDSSNVSLDKQLQFLIGNRLIYPDGTINSFVQRYLRQKVLKLFDAKPARNTKSKAS